jgi:hypothetical protein
MDQLAFDSYFAHTMNTPTLMAERPTTPSTHSESHTFDSIPTTIKMEDLQVPFSSPSPAPSSDPSMSQPPTTPAPSTSEGGRPVKKRKSWGQVLPEPKTSLPPRKRAKTEDEKEQRRIERVKRNRLAAHNSRERKRQEYEVLQADKDQMADKMQRMVDKMARMEAELKSYRKLYPGKVPESIAFDLSAPLSDVTPSTADTICPTQTTTSFPSPMSMSMDSLDSPRDSSCQPETPASSFEGASPEFDSTQYPAVILCDLQCRSDSVSASRPSRQMAATLAYLTLFNLTLPSTKNLLSSTISSTSTSSTKKALQLPQWNLLSAWVTLWSIFMARPSSVSAPTQTLTAFLTALMQNSLICRVPLAQLMLATRLSQRSSCIEDSVNETLSTGLGKAGPDDGDVLGFRLTSSSTRSLQPRRRRYISPLKRDTKRTRSLSGWENMGCASTRRRKES